jgi:pimeloyl-ACP methyl ester carboxylesterase
VRKWISKTVCISALSLFLAGCATPVIAPDRPNTVIIVPGIGGDGEVYAKVVRSLHDHGSDDCLRVYDWGSSWFLVLRSIGSSDLHDHAEHRLAERIIQWRSDHPGSRIALIGHSAGAGVVLGALPRLPAGMSVAPVILLAPAVSPDFDLRPALQHANVIHVFYSHRDDFWQGIAPDIFGNYDGVHRNGAGRKGFTLTLLDPSEKVRVVQHAYQDDWATLGNQGGHFDWMAEPFVGTILKPIIDAGRTDRHYAMAASKTKSSGQNVR